MDTNYKTLIAGRTSSGKDSIAHMLAQNYGWKILRSYATRKPRYPEENTHTFITEKEAEAFDKDQILTDAQFNGITYFSTIDQMNESDAYVVNPKAMPRIFEKMPNTFFTIVYIKAKDDDMRKAAAKKRANNNPSEMATFEKRDADEYEEFSDFEAKLAAYSVVGKNYDAVVIENDYNPETLHQMAASIEMQRRYHKNMRPIVQSLINQKMISTTPDGSAAIIWDKNDPNIKEEIPIQTLVARLSYDDPGMRKILGDTIANYLTILDAVTDPAAIPNNTIIPNETLEPNRNLFRTWTADTISQITEQILSENTEHIQMAREILKHENKASSLSEHVQMEMQIKTDSLHNEMLNIMEKEIRKTIRSIITPI